MKDLGAFDPLGLARSGLMYVSGGPEPVLLHGGVMDQATAIAAKPCHSDCPVRPRTLRNGSGSPCLSLWYRTLADVSNVMLSNVLSLGPMDISPDRLPPLSSTEPFPLQGRKVDCGYASSRGEILASLLQSHRPNRSSDRPRFSDILGRKVHCAELVAIFDKVFATKTRDEWAEILLKEKLMVCPVLNIDEIKDDSQARANNYVVDFKDRFLGDVKIPGYPVHLVPITAGTPKLAPTLGEHTDLVMHQMATQIRNPGTEKERVIK